MSGKKKLRRSYNDHRPYFKPVNPNISFPELEKNLLSKWYRNGVVKKYLNRNKLSRKYYSFLDGPITANNPMGIHHAWGRTYKDLWQRYKNMQGYRQRFQNGFDCQGLWVEVEVEKELGLKSKKEIENLVQSSREKSIDKFVQLCKERVYKYAEIQTEQSKRLAFFMDWDNSYFTLSNENNYMIWHFLKKCYEEGIIYKGRDSVPWCPRCGTAISQHEILTEDYREVTHDSLYVFYKIRDRKDEYILIWTTTPWTLPANIAVAVDPETDYVLGSADGKKVYLAEDFAKRLSLKYSKKLKGKKLLGLTYDSPFDILPKVREIIKVYKHRVISSDDRILPVTTDEGTGVVHVATGAGTEDFALGKKEELPVLAVIDEEAVYLEGLGEFSGKNAKDNPNLIIDYLKKSGHLFRIEKYRHRYPVCWRCKTELVWRVVDEWYIAMDKPLKNPKFKIQKSKGKYMSYRDAMAGVARKMRWIPEFGLSRELDWLNNMHDWLISKKRYWGLALPIWECVECGHFEVIGSEEELRKRAVDGWEKFSGHSPHKPWIDLVKIRCASCGSVVSRIPDVGNPWLDAGIVTYSTISEENNGKPLYLNNRREWKKWAPADFITESFPGQFKNWFYSLIAMSTMLENLEPTKTVLGFATLLAEDGRPMHKSWGNSIEFNEAADKIGVDVMRWMYLRQNYTDNLLFGYKKADEVRRNFHLTLWNIYNFFVTYSNLNRWKPDPGQPISLTNLLDVWAVARFRDTLIGVTKSLDRYDAKTSTDLIESLVSDLSLWFVRRSRNRVGTDASDERDKSDFFAVSHFILTHLSRILAPFTPYIADEMFNNLTKSKLTSVHLTDWQDNKFMNDLQLLLGKEEEIDKLMKHMLIVRKVVEKGHSVRKSKNLPVRQPLNSILVKSKEEVDTRLFVLIKDELNVKEVVWKSGTSEEINVKLDTKITSDLKEEAKARELIRKIQNERKKMGLDLSQTTSVFTTWLPKKKALLNWIKIKTSTKELAESDKFEVLLKE